MGFRVLRRSLNRWFVRIFRGMKVEGLWIQVEAGLGFRVDSCNHSGLYRYIGVHRGRKDTGESNGQENGKHNGSWAYIEIDMDTCQDYDPRFLVQLRCRVPERELNIILARDSRLEQVQVAVRQLRSCVSMRAIV